VETKHIKAKGMKMTPGISSFASHVEDIGEYFAPLFVNAAAVVPLEHQAATEVHILGTAGDGDMRPLETETTSHHITSHHITSLLHTISHYITLHHITEYHITEYHITTGDRHHFRIGGGLVTGEVCRRICASSSVVHTFTIIALLGVFDFVAGMRLVPEVDQERIWDRVVLVMQQEVTFPFHISRENVRTINGREEAYYAALSTNYIAKKIDSNLVYVSYELILFAV
jgi:hypothetical protein